MVIVVDMIGDADQQIYIERNSTLELAEEIWALAADLGYAEFFLNDLTVPIIDDHVPFLAQGVQAVDIIDFDYPYYHTVSDTPDKVAPESLERVGRVLEAFLEGGER
jgi:hypothetical protein